MTWQDNRAKNRLARKDSTKKCINNRLLMHDSGGYVKKDKGTEEGMYVQKARAVPTRSVHHVGGEAFNAHCDVASILR
jgi:hypothetical protein